MDASVICAIVVAVISGGSSVIATLVSSHATRQVLEWRIKSLEEKQDVYNDLQNRMIVVEQNIKSAKHRLDSVENNVNTILKGGVYEN